MFFVPYHRRQFISLSNIVKLPLLIFRWTSADASQLFSCAFVVTLSTATTLKITHDARKRKVEEDMRKFFEDIERVTGNLNQSINSIYILLIEDHQENATEAEAMEMSARGISMLQSLDYVSGEEKLGKVIDSSEPEGSNISPDVWGKVRNVLSRLFR